MVKDRILKNWTFSRGLYLVIGSGLGIEGLMSQNWPGLLIGLYFASMGLFAFGCAAGNCHGGTCEVEPSNQTKKSAPN